MMDDLLTPTGSGLQQLKHRPAAKAYVAPSLKIYGGVAQLTANGTGPTPEDASDPSQMCNGGADTKKNCIP